MDLRRTAVFASVTLGLGGAALAATPQAYADLDRGSAAACITASGLRQASIGPPVRFSDRMGVDVRTVTGIYPQPHMRGARATMLCLYDRRTRRAEVQETATAPTLPPAPAPQVKDIRWRAQEIAGRPAIEGASVTLTLSSDGKVSGRSGCNQYSGAYQLTGLNLRVSPQLISTRMACAPAIMEQELRYQRLLVEGRSVEVTPRGDLIVITAGNGRIRFSAERRSN